MAKTILVADDTEVCAHSSKITCNIRFSRRHCERWTQSLFTSPRRKPDLTILDLMMPEMGGYDFMRHHSREAETPIIVLTAKSTRTTKFFGLELGADDYVTSRLKVQRADGARAVLRRGQECTGSRNLTSRRNRPRPQQPPRPGPQRIRQSNAIGV